MWLALQMGSAENDDGDVRMNQCHGAKTTLEGRPFAASEGEVAVRHAAGFFGNRAAVIRENDCDGVFPKRTCVQRIGDSPDRRIHYLHHGGYHRAFGLIWVQRVVVGNVVRGCLKRRVWRMKRHVQEQRAA